MSKKTVDMSMLLVTVWLYMLGLSQGICPSKCVCDESVPSVQCVSAGLADLPEQLNYQIRTLNLAHNNLRQLSRAVSVYSHLEVIILSHNRLSSIDHLGPGSIPNAALNALHLQKNRIATIAKGAFHLLQRLQHLHLDENLLRSLPSERLSSLSYLEVLSLNRNPLRELQANVFHGMDQLMHLEL
ncbi:unnamed protein product, partial [Meganyctiphanes norvegica]